MVRNGKQYNKINRIPLISSATVIISHIESPSSFFVQPKNHITDDLILREPSELPLMPLSSEMTNDSLLGYYCMAPLEDLLVDDEIVRQYGRARIIDVNFSLVEVRYIDEGKTEWVDPICLAEMPENFYYHPWQTIHCCLGGINPTGFLLESNPEQESRGWTETDADHFRQVVNRFPLFKVVSIQGTNISNDNSRVNIVELYGLENSFSVSQRILETDIVTFFRTQVRPLSWSDSDVEQVREKFGNLFKKHSVENPKIDVSDLLVLERLYTAPIKILEIDVAGLFSAEFFQTVIYSPLYNASMFPIPVGPINDQPTTVIDPRFEDFPLRWTSDERKAPNRKTIPKSSMDTDGFGVIYSSSDFQVPNMNCKYFSENGYYSQSGVVTFHILSARLNTPYEFYGIPLRNHNPENKEVLPTREAFRQMITERKELAAELETFYSLSKNRYQFKIKDILSGFNGGIRFYGIYICSQLDRRSQFGRYQRVEIIAVDPKEGLMLRFLDSGGTTEAVDITDVYQIASKHCTIPAMALQLCWQGVRDENLMFWVKSDFHPFTLKAFRQKFFTDGPVQLTLLENHNRKRCRYGKERPIVYEMWNVCFCTNIELSPTLTKEPNLFKMLNFDGQIVESRL
ncbi:unnamed protein product, partial [Mesorhabditis belari]|uniref:Tudor domain-containing protein n=1 Tax=Mesorhabditis belari TaxID=2138241 RepID=A0AAF3J6S1_9BILA